jgi:CHAT domain-containing protein/Flp pilus assembly protein TadD
MRSLFNQLTLFVIFCLSVVAPSQGAFGYAINLFRQSTQESCDTGGQSGGEKDVRALEPCKPHRHEIGGGQRHNYRVRLAAGQFLKAIIEQDGIDVVAHLSGPDGKLIMEFDSDSRLRGQEIVSQVAEAEGDYKLVVEPKLKQAPTGSYEIRIEELRVATENDRALQEARKLYKKATGLNSAGKYDEAIPSFERALEIRERVLGPDHCDVASVINSMGQLQFYKGEYSKAEQLFLRGLAVREKALGPEHPLFATSLNNYAILCFVRGDYAKAEPLFLRALAIREKALGPEHSDVAASLNNLALLYSRRGEYSKAEQLFLRGLAIGEKALGPEHPDVAKAYTNLANLHYFRGDYAKAEPLHRRAVAITEKALGPDHPLFATSLNNLALLYSELGDYAKAEPLHRRALAIREKSLGPEHPDVATSLYNLASINNDLGDYAKAEPLHRRALAIREKALGAEHPLLASSLNSLATLSYFKGDYAKAELLYQRALTVSEKALGPDHPNVATYLNNLARLYRVGGDLAKAEQLHQRALVIWEKSIGPEQPDVGKALNDLAILHMAKNDVNQAIAFMSRANAVSERNLALNLAIGSERQKLTHLAALSKQTDQTITLHLRYAPHDPVARRLALALILQRKGRALDATSESVNSLRGRLNAEDQALLDRLAQTRSQLARLILRGLQKMTAEQYRGQIKELEDQAERYETDISLRSSEFRTQSLHVTLEAVQAAIPADAALIEFATYHPFKAKATKVEAYGQPRCVAYILRHNGEIQSKELGAAKPIDDAIAALRKSLRNPNRRDVKRLARAVDERVFQPLRPLLGEQTRLLISPDGQLNLIPFASLVDEQGRYLVERYSISYLASGRDLLRLQVARESKDGPMVVAAPDFGRRSQVEASRLRKREKDASEGQVKKESARSVIREFYFPPLPYAAQEGEALRALLPGSTLLTKGQATKAALGQARSPLILHVATHSFFLEDLKLAPPGGRGYQPFDEDPKHILKQIEESGIRIESPLLRSGLALAGANEHTEEDNGILTALEVTGLNLWGTKLVVLSACDTGVGEVKNGDGVHGLRRALALAGSETQVMSLWAVLDKVTRDLMVAYYRKLKEGKGRGEALRQVQLEMLKQVRRRHPYYWASFIQSGEWANLDGRR